MASPVCDCAAADVNVLFFRDAESLYGSGGFAPATAHSAGIDLRACLDAREEELVIAAGERMMLPTGVAVEPLVPGMAGFVYSRSGLGAVKGLVVAQGVGLIDPDYRGEIFVYLLNTSALPYALTRGERIAQLVFQPFVRITPRFVSELGATERGGGGFGHTGS